MNNKQLTRYWFKSVNNLGVGITAYSLDDARWILDRVIKDHMLNVEIKEIIEGVDIRSLHQGKVIPNMNPPNFRGVWFPKLNENLTHKYR